MDNKAKARSMSRRCGHILLLCLGLLGYPALAADGPAEAAASHTTVTQTVLGNETLAALALKQLPAPAALQEFTKLTIGKLAQDAPFLEWKTAQTVYYPLGPGTHSWLVNVQDSTGQRIGYLIISATEQGGYALSEYGAGTSGLPYSLTELRQYLAQEALIPLENTASPELSALYAPLRPVWKLTLNGQSLYLSAAGPELLPWNDSEAQAALSTENAAAGTWKGEAASRSPLPAFWSGGEDDPYADIRWLTAPKLEKFADGDLKRLLGQGKSLAFQSAGQNEAYSAPYMITGYQRWDVASGGTTAIVYAASGPEGRRFLPLAQLQALGTLQPLPAAENVAISSRP